MLRAREARIHKTTRALLDCIEAFTHAPDPDGAVNALFSTLRDVLGADCSALIRCEPGRRPKIVSSTEAALIDQELSPPFDPTVRIRNLADISASGIWHGIPLTGYRAALLAPAKGPQGTKHALICLRRTGSFAKADEPIIARVAGLAVQAVTARALAAENALLAATIQGSSSGFAIADATRPENPLVYVNDAFQRLSGYSAAEVIGKNCRFLNAEPRAAPSRQRLRDTVAQAKAGRFLLRNRRKSGEMFWNELAIYPVHGPGGEVTHLVATQTDVTDHVEARAERDRMQAWMERALAATDDALVLLDSDLTVLFANAAMSDLFPVGPEGWRAGRSFGALLDQYQTEMTRRSDRKVPKIELNDIEALLALGAGREFDLADGRSVLMRARAMDEGAVVLCATDFTAQKTARMLLEQRLSAIEASHDGIAITDDDGRLAYLNRAAATALGYGSSHAALGRSWSSGYDSETLPDLRQGFSARLRRSPSQAGPAAEHEVTASALAGGGAVIVLRDITDRVKIERREAALRDALAQAQRREAVAQLAAGIAHDFNNLLSAITGSAHLISTDATTPEVARSHAQRISAAGTRAARLVNRLLDRGGAPAQGGVFDLRDALSDMPQLVQSSLPATIRFAAQPTPSTLLRGDADTLSQIVVNLILNARDAIGAGPGEISLSVAQFEPAQVHSLPVGTLQMGTSYAVLTVSDSGVGMDAATLARAFEAYFTTKGDAGTGLGLALVASQMLAVGGGIDLASDPEGGTTVSLFWPCVEAAPAQEPIDQKTPTVDALAGMTILVVDDEPEIGEVLQSYLERFGAEVCLCVETEDAIEAVTEAPLAWSAIVTDYDMPGLTGGDLVEEVARVAPDLPVFLVTALARRLVDARVAPDRVAGIFAKPVDLARLCAALACVGAVVKEERIDAIAARRRP
ncbi:MAG: PAS domain S-box protein [Pseudomonadota bacterium]